MLELGGSDPFIVLSTSDLDDTVEKAVAGRLENSGQACNGSKRLIVLDEYYDAFVEKFTAAMQALTVAPDPTQEGGDLGPLSSEKAAVTLEKQLASAVEGGATLVGGERDGAFITPGVLTGVSPDNPVFRQELFGPVAQVYRVASVDEAIELANDTPYGLGSVVISEDHGTALAVAARLEAGMVYVNQVGGDSAELPFGGVKNSGSGRELGSLGIDEFVNKKLIRIADAPQEA